MRIKSNGIQFWLSVCIGWYFCGKIWEFAFSFTESRGNKLSKNEFWHGLCPPCRESVCPACDYDEARIKNIRFSRNMNVENSFFRKYPYKSQNSKEGMVNRWEVVSEKHRFEMINEEPRIGLIGMHNLEKIEIDSVAKNFIKGMDHDEEMQFARFWKKTDPFQGTLYYVHTRKKNHSPQYDGLSLYMQRKYAGKKPKVIDIQLIDNKEMITVISPIQGVSDRFKLFLERFEETLQGNLVHTTVNIKLLFVIFKDSKNETNSSVMELLDVINSFKAKNPHAIVEHIFAYGKFNRALGLHTGVLHCQDMDLMLFLDVDLLVTREFFERIRANTVQNRSVVFPVTFSQYDPQVIDRSSNIGAIPESVARNKLDINENTGFWIHYAFGITAMYKSDYLRVSGFRLDISGWGGEDVDLYKKFVSDTEIQVFSAVDPNLIHIYHNRGCDPNLASDQYRMCVGSWSEMLGSQIEIANLHLRK